MEQHLSELRTRLMRSFCVFLTVFFCCYRFSDDIYNIISNPIVIYLDPAIQFVTTQVMTPFVVPLQLSFLCTILLCAPYLLYQIWMFLRPGLYKRERKNLAPIIICSVTLFYMGFSFAIFVLCPMLLDFFTNCAPVGVQIMLDIGSYIDFIITIAVATGIGFQIPLVTNILIRYKIISKQQFIARRKHIIVLSLILALLIAPPDLYSQILLAIPIWVLFECGLLCSRA